MQTKQVKQKKSRAGINPITILLLAFLVLLVASILLMADVLANRKSYQPRVKSKEAFAYPAPYSFAHTNPINPDEAIVIVRGGEYNNRN